MAHRICVPPNVFEELLDAYPEATVEADEKKKYTRIDGIEYSAPLVTP